MSAPADRLDGIAGALRSLATNPGLTGLRIADSYTGGLADAGMHVYALAADIASVAEELRAGSR